MIKPLLQQHPRVTVSDSFWLKYRQLVREEMIPFQWDVLNDRGNIVIESEREDATIPTEKSHVIENFRIAQPDRRKDTITAGFSRTAIWWYKRSKYSQHNRVGKG